MIVVRSDDSCINSSFGRTDSIFFGNGSVDSG